MNHPAVRARSRRLLVSRIAVVALALVASYYTFYSIKVIWSPHGLIGFYIDKCTAIVQGVAPSNHVTGIQVGDRVDLAAMPFRERAYLYEQIKKPVGMRITIPFFHGGHRRVVTITVDPFHSRPDMWVFMWARKIVATLFTITGVMLVWNRPSIMLWGLAVFLIGTYTSVVFGPFASPVIAALLIFGYAFAVGLSLFGLIVFAARFPHGRTNNSTKIWDVAAVGLFFWSMLYSLHDYVPLFIARPIPDWPDFQQYPYSGTCVAILVVLCIKLRKETRSTRAAFGWIVAGYGVGIVIGGTALTGLFRIIGGYNPPLWPGLGQQALLLAFPASVAYSLVRHRSFDLGYLTNRALVFAALTIGVVSTFLIGVWVMSSQLSSTLGIGSAMFVALLVGMMFQAQHGRAIRFVDRIFLPQRYEVGVSLDRIRERLRGTNEAKRVADEVAETLGLASVAVFERTSDGGFVRNAACGWPDGTAWHLLPGEGLTHSLEGAATVIALPDELSGGCGFSTAQARPRVALTIRRGGRVERAVLVGPYRDGASLDRDAIRSVHGVFDDALVV